MLGVRTTITLDEDVAARLQRLMRERGISFKEAVNVALHAGLGQERQARPYTVPVHDMGLRPGIDLDRALQLDATLEDDEVVRKLELRK